MTSRIWIFVLFYSALLIPLAQALDELPLGTTKQKMIQVYGQPNSVPIQSGPGPKSTAEDVANTACYFSLKPPRFYHFRDDRAVSVHYYDLTGRDFNYIKGLLKIHAVGSEIDEIDPKAIGWESTLPIIAKAWRCSKAGWVALYRVFKGTKPETSPSLLIYIENKK
jgi:hypothetical protein